MLMENFKRSKMFWSIVTNGIDKPLKETILIDVKIKAINDQKLKGFEDKKLFG